MEVDVFPINAPTVVIATKANGVWLRKEEGNSSSLFLLNCQ